MQKNIHHTFFIIVKKCNQPKITNRKLKNKLLQTNTIANKKNNVDKCMFITRERCTGH